MRTKCAVASAALLSLLILSACGSAPVRSAERFCGELTAHKDDIHKLPQTPEEVSALINLYSRMGEVAPLEIQADWDQLSTNLKTADSVDVNNPTSVQGVADAAYATQRSAENLVTWAQTTCGLDLGPVGGAEPAITTTS